MCHLNIRSISKNLSSFENYLEIIQYDFTIIGLTETWLNDTNYDWYGLQGYHFIEQHRSSMGGWVALCIMKHLNYLERHDLAIYDNDIESVFIEINKDNFHSRKNIIVGVLYRPPGNDIRTFNEKFELILQKIRRENKISYILGDFNINLLNNDCQQPTGEFFDLMSSNTFFTTDYKTNKSECKFSHIDWSYIYQSFWQFFAVQWGYISDWYHRSLPDIPYQSSNHCLWNWNIHGKKTV